MGTVEVLRAVRDLLMDLEDEPGWVYVAPDVLKMHETLDEVEDALLEGVEDEW